MFGADLVVDRQAKDARQPEGARNVKTGAGGGQILDAAGELLSGGTKFDDPAPMGGYARILPAFVQGLLVCHLRRSLRRDTLVRLGRERTREHVSARALARVTDKSIALHIAHDRMRRDRNVDHFGPALRTHGGVVFWIQPRHRWSRLKTCPRPAAVQVERCRSKK